MNGRNDIIRPGQVKRQNKGALTSASEVMDWNLKKSQEEINKRIGSGGAAKALPLHLVYGTINEEKGATKGEGDSFTISEEAIDGAYCLKDEVDAIIASGNNTLVIVYFVVSGDNPYTDVYCVGCFTTECYQFDACIPNVEHEEYIVFGESTISIQGTK